MLSPIVLLTDFGHIDPYVGQMKGVVATLAPQAPVIDLCHGVRPQSVGQAGYFLASSFSHFPEGSVFVCVVDPGVGTDRSIICVHADGRYVLAPDNGLVAPLLSDYPGAACYRMHLDTFGEASLTFHGRDIFCPLAAQIVLGKPIRVLGDAIPISDLISPEWMVPLAEPGGVTCRVQHIDTFGNVVLNLPVVPWLERIALWDCLEVQVGSCIPVMRTTTFGQLEEGQVGCIAGSQGCLELVCNGSSAARFLGVDIGDTVNLTERPEREIDTEY